MTPDDIIAIVESANVPYTLGAKQKQYNQVRFFNDKTNRSLNLGYRNQQSTFVADFVFKGESKDINEAKRDSFLRLYKGEPGKRSTAFARLELNFSEKEWLVRIIQDYWAMEKLQAEA